MVFGKQTFDRGRYALVRITANHDWLTGDDDDDESPGWSEIEDALKSQKVLPHRTHDPAIVELKFVEWTGEDQE